MEIRTKSKKKVLQPEGELTIFEAAEFHKALVELQGQEGARILDLSQVERMDTSGVQLILASMQTKEIALTGVSPGIQEKFERIGFQGVLQGDVE